MQTVPRGDGCECGGDGVTEGVGSELRGACFSFFCGQICFTLSQNERGWSVCQSVSQCVQTRVLNASASATFTDQKARLCDLNEVKHLGAADGAGEKDVDRPAESRSTSVY